MTAATWTAAELGRTRLITLKPRKPPAQRAYEPKPADPGQRVSWTRGLGYGRAETRCGEIWSAGALPGSVWVQADCAPRGDMSLVMLRSMIEHPAYPPSWQKDTVKRCENLRRSKGIFAEYVTRTRYSYGKGNTEYQDTIAYHADRDCPQIRHETRDCHDWEPTVSSTIRMLLSATARGRSDLCRRCIYLVVPGLDEADDAR